MTVKMITGPLSKILATENRILNMSKHQKLFQKSFSENVMKAVVGFLEVNNSVILNRGNQECSNNKY